jgi:hypothetical protein
LITSVTLLAVHTSPRNPYDSAPLANSAGICAFWSVFNRGLTPLGGCASFSPSFDPVAYCPLADPQSSGDIFLLPTFLFQFTRSFPSFFSPIGFLWCSHASYCLILYFFLSRSVVPALSGASAPTHHPHNPHPYRDRFLDEKGTRLKGTAGDHKGPPNHPLPPSPLRDWGLGGWRGNSNLDLYAHQCSQV